VRLAPAFRAKDTFERRCGQMRSLVHEAVAITWTTESDGSEEMVSTLRAAGVATVIASRDADFRVLQVAASTSPTRRNPKCLHALTDTSEPCYRWRSDTGGRPRSPASNPDTSMGIAILLLFRFRFEQDRALEI